MLFYLLCDSKRVLFMLGNFYFRSIHRRCSIRKSVFINFAKLTEKHLCQSLFFNKAAEKKRLWHSCFPVNCEKFLRTPFSQNTSGRLLLHLFQNRVLLWIPSTHYPSCACLCNFHWICHKDRCIFLHIHMKSLLYKYLRYIFWLHLFS